MIKITLPTMRWLSILAASFLLVACAGDGPSVDLAPAMGDNAVTGTHIKDAKDKAQGILKNGAKPGDKVTVGLVKDLTAAQASQVKTAADLVTAQKQAAKLEAEHAADQKAIAKRNVYLVWALFIGALVFYVGEWAKLSNPYTTLLPNVVAGLLSVMIACGITAAVIALWSSFGWLIHLF